VHDDHRLLARARQLDPEALAEIHDTYYPIIFRHISFRVSDTQAAEDLTSEVFIRLLAALRDRHAPQDSLSGWLYRVAAHVVADYHRRGYRATQVELDETMPSHDSGPLEMVESQMVNERLRDAIKDLTDDQQMALDLRFGQGRSIRQTAAAMGKTEGSVKQLQARALAMLAKRLSEGDSVL